jgi:hypothetical protein
MEQVPRKVSNLRRKKYHLHKHKQARKSFFPNPYIISYINMDQSLFR